MSRLNLFVKHRYGYAILFSIICIISSSSVVMSQAKFTKSVFGLTGHTTFSNPKIDFVDFNNDGRLDLFKINGNTVQFFINKPGTTLTFQKEPYQITTTGLIWAKPIDYNFDGLIDVAIYNGSLTVYLTELEGTSYINTPIAIPSVNASGQVIFQDINNDTKIDILKLDVGTFSVYTNVGNNSFELGYSYTFDNYLSQHLTNFRVINYNNDVFYDVATGPYIFTNFGNSIFSFTHNFFRSNEDLGSFGFINVENSLFTDVNFDNRLDSYVNFSFVGSSFCDEQNFNNGNANSLLQYLNGASGTFDIVKKTDSYECNRNLETKLVASADFDGDNKADLVSTIFSYYRNESDGSVSNVTNQMPFGLTTLMNEVSNVNEVDFSVLDINKDGRIDLAYIFNSKLTFLLNVMGTTPATVPAPSGLVSAIADTEVKASWTAPTNCIGCTYDVYLRKGIDTVYLSNVGNVQSPANGNWSESNLGSTTNWLFKNLENGVYNWSVRVNYQSKKLSAFAAENSFTINKPGNGTELTFNNIVDFDGAVGEDNSVWLALQKSNGATFSRYTYNEVSSSFVKVSQDAFRLNAKKSKVTSVVANSILLKSYLKGDSIFLVKDKTIVMKHKLLYPQMDINYAITYSSTNSQYLIAILYADLAPYNFYGNEVSTLHLEKLSVSSSFKAITSIVRTFGYIREATHNLAMRFSYNSATKNYFLVISDLDKSLSNDERTGSSFESTVSTFILEFNSNLQEISFSEAGDDAFREYDSYNNKVIAMERKVSTVRSGVYGLEYPTYEIFLGSTQLTRISNGVPNTGARLPYLTRLSKRNEYAAFWLNQDNSTLFYNYLDPQSLQRQIPNDQIVEKINSKKYKILSNSSASSLLLGWLNGSDFNLKRLDLFKNPPPELLSMNVPKVGNTYRAYAGDLVKITGKNFGKTTLTNTVKFGSIQASVVQGLANGNEITVIVPPGLTRDPVPVTVTFDDQIGQSTFMFENLTLPIVSSIDTMVGEVGDVVTVTGAKFATDPTQMAVRFGAIAVAQDEIISVTSTQIKVKVPKMAQRGSGQTVSVVIQDQVVPAPQLFRVIIPPIVESLETETDFVSCKQVIIRGKNFGNNPNALQVKFGNTTVPTSDLIATDIAIIVNVPLGAEGAIKISIKVDDREAFSEIIDAKLGSNIEPGSNLYPHNFKLTARKDDKVDLRIKILNECSVQEVKFWKKGISEPDLNWKNEVLTTLDANRIDHVILEDAMTDPIGLEAYYEILDKSSKSVRSDTFRIYKQFSELDSTNFVPGLAFGGDIVDYNIISIPYQLTSNGLTSVFKDIFNVYGYDSTKWRVYHYNNDGQQTPKYVEYLRGLTEINPGKGYWIIIRNEQDIFIDKGTTVDLDNGPFEITLQPGWNQIGNPYDFEIMWSDVLSYNGNPAGIESLKTYKSGAFVAASSLPRFTGGFIRYNGSTPLALKIPYINKKSTGGRTQSGLSYTTELTSDEWRLNLNLAAGGMVNQLASVGIHPHALIETDPLDEHAMPLIGGFANISFDGNLAASILPTANSHSWSFVVNSLMNTESMTLSWDNAHFGNNDLQIFLYDREEERLINMRTNSTHTFKNRSKYPFEIHFGSQQYIDESTSPERTVLGNVYPNPMTESTRIPFTVTTDQTSTQLVVYSLQGQQLRTLIHSELKAGFYEAEWDGRDASGNKISNGLVLVRLQTTVGNRIQSSSKKVIINR
jgi:hypothetical protein